MFADSDSQGKALEWVAVRSATLPFALYFTQYSDLGFKTKQLKTKAKVKWNKINFKSTKDLHKEEHQNNHCVYFWGEGE